MSEAEIKPARGSLRRAPALLLCALVVAAVVAPALRDPPRDSFPLSTYPMFSTVRKQAWIHVIVGFDAQDNERAIPPRLVANVEVMQAAETIRIAVRRRRPKLLCEQVAARVADDPEFAQIVRLEVQSRRFDPRTYFVEADGKIPLKLRRRAGCEIPEDGA
ncbi:hypothetical protein [Enhygromyxa salina]|uniref:Uncharacterized protein n=1 Tax=Enhygromyxa salina TaxID=215803 RepID=A0A2S9XPX7_9BACT|nr:hypothetical protein [Enhygromyxa salina]PRP94919.1 hypothetical protein ENSA7_77420 [Enhygromyxa salina]